MLTLLCTTGKQHIEKSDIGIAGRTKTDMPSQNIGYIMLIVIIAGNTMDRMEGFRMTIEERFVLMTKCVRVGWHYLWWSRHVTRARYHDYYIESIMPQWKKRL